MKFIECQLKDIEQLLETYVKTITSPFDSFLEAHIVSSQHFLVEYQEKIIGYFSIHQQELLTQFFIIKEYRQYSQEIFFKIRKMQNVRFAFVSTSDEFFLSCALDDCTKVEKQAYFFKDCLNKDIDPSISLSIAKPQDIEMIIKHSGDFFDNLEDKIPQEQIFIANKNQETVGFGIIEKGIVLKDYISIGMFTIPSYRKQGIGKNILLHLKEIVYQQDKYPIAGCWYYNHYSKKTLESAGFISDTRLLKIHY